MAEQGAPDKLTARQLYLLADRITVRGSLGVGAGDLAVALEAGAPPGQLWLVVTCHLGEEVRTRRAIARLRAKDHKGPPGGQAPAPRRRQL